MSTQKAFDSNSNSFGRAAHDAEATLRLIATLPTPVGLEKRVIARVRSAPRSGRVLSWPGLVNPTENWFRTAAAAAIVFVVIGGGWEVNSRVQSISSVAAPPSTGAAGAFSNAGAVRVPQSLPAPVIAQPTPVQPVVTEPSTKVRHKVAPTAHRNAKPVAENKPSDPPSQSAAK
jgi:hypothetical protein